MHLLKKEIINSIFIFLRHKLLIPSFICCAKNFIFNIFFQFLIKTKQEV